MSAESLDDSNGESKEALMDKAKHLSWSTKSLRRSES